MFFVRKIGKDLYQVNDSLDSTIENYTAHQLVLSELSIADKDSCGFNASILVASSSSIVKIFNTQRINLEQALSLLPFGGGLKLHFKSKPNGLDMVSNYCLEISRRDLYDFEYDDRNRYSIIELQELLNELSWYYNYNQLVSVTFDKSKM